MALDKEKMFSEVIKYFGGEGTKSASGLVEVLIESGTILTNSDLLRDDRIYPYVKSRLLMQGVKLPKHAHESIMQDFNDIFGGKVESSTILIKTVKNVGISVEEFKNETDSMNKEDIKVDERVES